MVWKSAPNRIIAVDGQFVQGCADEVVSYAHSLGKPLDRLIVTHVGFPPAGTYRTPEGITANVMATLAQKWEDWTAHDDAYVVDGENVVVLARYTAVHKATGKPPNTSGWPITSSLAAGSSSGSSSSSTPHWCERPWPAATRCGGGREPCTRFPTPCSPTRPPLGRRVMTRR
ncbi:nuclear transport factor 2 family protein [Kutzneria sp. NPDC051319]|uniref:nuclear transport factor 2 family protein n=1 Tax=Kutzneria sp. NPDC051319 TaxID=3155047 RepID=UPI00342B43CD